MDFSNLSDSERKAVILAIISTYLKITSTMFRLIFEEINKLPQESSAPRPPE